jgi:hypothetical protein
MHKNAIQKRVRVSGKNRAAVKQLSELGKKLDKEFSRVIEKRYAFKRKRVNIANLANGSVGRRLDEQSKLRKVLVSRKSSERKNKTNPQQRLYEIASLVGESNKSLSLGYINRN